MILRLAVDAMLESGEAQRAVDFLETLAPEYAQLQGTQGHRFKGFFTGADFGEERLFFVPCPLFP